MPVIITSVLMPFLYISIDPSRFGGSNTFTPIYFNLHALPIGNPWLLDV